MKRTEFKFRFGDKIRRVTTDGTRFFVTVDKVLVDVTSERDKFFRA